MLSLLQNFCDALESLYCTYRPIYPSMFDPNQLVQDTKVQKNDANSSPPQSRVLNISADPCVQLRVGTLIL